MHSVMASHGFGEICQRSTPRYPLDCSSTSTDGKELGIDCELAKEAHVGSGPRMVDLWRQGLRRRRGYRLRQRGFR